MVFRKITCLRLEEQSGESFYGKIISKMWVK